MLTYTFAPDAEFRLMLPHHAADFSRLIIKDHEMIGQWLPWAKPDFDEGKALEMIQRFMRRLGNNEAMFLGMFYKGEFAGWICYRQWEWGNLTTEIGYWLGTEFQGKGLVTAAVRAMTDYAFYELGFNRIEILMEPENTRSAAVPQRLGYKLEGVKRQSFVREDQPRDLAIYAMLKEEWEINASHR